MKLSKLGVLAVLAVIVAYVRIIYFTPIEALQGAAQKIFYVHLPSALMGFVAVGIAAVAGGLYLWLRDARLDRISESAVEVGLVFLTAVLVTGPLWARPIWGTFWTWDARLTLTLFLWFILVGYVILRGAIENPELRARYSAVLAIMGAILVPFIHLSVYLFRTLHPQPILIKPSAPSMPGDMVETMMISLGAWVLLFAWLLHERYLLAVEREHASEALERDDALVASPVIAGRGA